MSDLLGQLNTREIATLVWGGGVALWVSTLPGARRALGQIVWSVIGTKIGALLLMVALFQVALVGALRTIGYWHAGLLKDTVVWFLLAGISLAFDSIGSRHSEPLVRRVLKKSVGVFFVFEFLAGAYTLPLVWELLLLPFMTFVVMMDTYAERKTAYRSAKRVTEGVLLAFGVFMLGSVTHHLVVDSARVGNPDALRELTLPVVLSLGFVPVALLVGALSTYEQVFLRMFLGPKKNPAVVRFAKWRIAAQIGWDLGRAHRFIGRNALDLMHLQSRKDVQNLLLKERVQYAADRRAHVGTWRAVEGGEEG